MGYRVGLALILPAFPLRPLPFVVAYWAIPGKCPLFRSTGRWRCDVHAWRCVFYLFSGKQMGMPAPRCARVDYSKGALYGLTGSGKRGFYAKHAKAGMIDVVTKRCRHERYSTVPSYGMAESGKRKFCAKHTRAGMINIKSKKYRHQTALR